MRICKYERAIFAFNKTRLCAGPDWSFRLDSLGTDDTDLEPGLTDWQADVWNSDQSLPNTSKEQQAK